MLLTYSFPGLRNALGLFIWAKRIFHCRFQIFRNMIGLKIEGKANRTFGQQLMYPVHMNSVSRPDSQTVMEIPQNFWENLCKLSQHVSQQYMSKTLIQTP